MGDFREMILGVRSNPIIRILEIDSYTQNLLFEVITVARFDWFIQRPAALLTMDAVDD